MEDESKNKDISSMTAKELLEVSWEHALHSERLQAWLLLTKLEKSNSKWRGNPTDEKHHAILSYIYFAAQPYLTEYQLMKFYSKYFSPILQKSEILYEEVKTGFKLMLLDLVKEDQQKRRMLVGGLLMSNEEKLTHKEMTVGGKKHNVGKVRDWIQDFLFFLRNAKTEKSIALSIQEYVRTGKNGRILSEEERDAVVKLLEFYSYVPQSAFHQTGFPEDIIFYTEKGEQYILTEGDLLSLTARKGSSVKKNKEKNEVDFVRFLSRQWSDFEAGKLFRAIEKARRGNTEKRSDMLKEAMYSAINEGEVDIFSGIAATLAMSGVLREQFKNDQRYVEFWEKHLQNHWDDIGKQTKQIKKEVEEEIAEFKKDPAHSKYITLFFKEVLEKKMHLSSEESAMIGIYLSNAARHGGESEYGKMAYGDLDDGTFKWNL